MRLDLVDRSQVIDHLQDSSKLADIHEAGGKGDHQVIRGIIFRDVHAPYRSGRTDVLKKHKFIKEIDAYVVEVGKGGKENAVLAVRDSNGKEVIVGQVSTIGKGKIEVGQTLEVAFLYITNLAKPVLFQPTILRVRTDKSGEECSIDQLKDSVTDKSVSSAVSEDTIELDGE